MYGMLYNDSMKKQQPRNGSTESIVYQGLRVWAHTNRKLRIIAALRDESIIALVDRLANEEMARLEAKQTDAQQAS